MKPAATADADMVQTRSLGRGVAEIRLARPERANALNAEMANRLTSAVGKCYLDGSRVVVLRGSGRNFCSGFDRSAGSDDVASIILALGIRIEAVLQLIYWAPFVTVAVVHGHAVGAGADLVAACDYRIADDTAVFSFPGFRLFGVSLGNRRLAESIGSHNALDGLLRARRLDHVSAKRQGLVTHSMTIANSEEFIEELATFVEHTDGASIARLRDSTRHGQARGPFRHGFTHSRINSFAI